MHYYGVLKQSLSVYDTLLTWRGPRWEIYHTLILLIYYCITIMGTVIWFILHIIFINTIFSFCTALLPSIAIRIRTQEMRHLYGDLAGVNRIVNKPYIVFNNELGLIWFRKTHTYCRIYIHISDYIKIALYLILVYNITILKSSYSVVTPTQTNISYFYNHEQLQSFVWLLWFFFVRGFSSWLPRITPT